jgi:hypothetical protein
MGIKTKHDVGDTVFFIHQGKVTKDSVDIIVIEAARKDRDADIKYRFKDGQFYNTFGEFQVFKDKESLLLSL